MVLLAYLIYVALPMCSAERAIMNYWLASSIQSGGRNDPNANSHEDVILVSLSLSNTSPELKVVYCVLFCAVTPRPPPPSAAVEETSPRVSHFSEANNK